MTSALKVLLFAIVAMAVLVPAARAADELEMPLFAISPYVGQAYWSDEIGLDDSLIYGGRAAVMFLPWLGVEGTYGRTSTDTDFAPGYDTDVEHFGLDLLLNLAPGRCINPYLTGGWSRFDIDSSGNTVTGLTNSLNGWEYGGGLKIRLHEIMGRRTDLRLDVRNVINDLCSSFPNDGDWTNNVIASAGLQFTFGRMARDSDNDGVRDRDDMCADTPAGAPVDAMGCPLDADGDGVFDNVDKCPGTLSGAPVDAMGCALDSDADGVIDLYDECAATPAGVEIDKAGCPLDSDGDGVFDGLDKCPETPGHLKVDKNGCPIEISKMETELLDTGMISTSQISFGSGNSNLDAQSHAILDEIALTLSHWPELRVEIGGHTDSQGSAKSNQKLSERRATAVLDYLKLKHPEIDSAQYSVAGYGENAPIADNSTREGRAANRRVEFKVLNTDVIKRVIKSSGMMEK